MMIPMMLKKRWQKASCSDDANVSASAANAANIPVVVVPIFAPKVRGYILSILIIPTPTKGVNVEVKIDEL